MSATQLQLVAEQAPQVVQHPRLGGGMQPVAAVVDPHPGDLEAARESPRPVLRLQHGGGVPRCGQASGEAEAGRSGPEHDYPDPWSPPWSPRTPRGP